MAYELSQINVSEEDGIVDLFIELQGQGYPGSIYTLRYLVLSQLLMLPPLATYAKALTIV